MVNNIGSQSASLPILPTWSLILLKFLLAVIGVNNANPMGAGITPQDLHVVDQLFNPVYQTRNPQLCRSHSRRPMRCAIERL
jgi:hypothetical protein